MTTPSDIAAQVRSGRRALRLTQSELAAAAGVGLRFIVDLEAGKPSVHLDKTLDVLAALGLQIRVVARVGLVPPGAPQ